MWKKIQEYSIIRHWQTECKERGISHILLEATEAGRALYERYSFVGMKDEMKFKEK